MIYQAHLEEELFKFCQLGNIPIVNGVIPRLYMPMVEKFLRYKTKSDRIKTRAIEEDNAFKMTKQIKDAIKDQVESPIEEFMLTALVQNGLEEHCRTQFEIGTKRVDFAFPIAKLVVECDGKKYHFSDGEQIERDQKRDVYLAKKGWRVKHFDGLMIRRNINACIEEIRNLLNPFILKTV